MIFVFAAVNGFAFCRRIEPEAVDRRRRLEERHSSTAARFIVPNIITTLRHSYFCASRDPKQSTSSKKYFISPKFLHSVRIILFYSPVFFLGRYNHASPIHVDSFSPKSHAVREGCGSWDAFALPLSQIKFEIQIVITNLKFESWARNYFFDE